MTRRDADTITIRRARPADEAALERLAALDSARPLRGETLVAEVDGELWAARSLDEARTISDPFRPAEEARALLALRAARLNGTCLRGRGATRRRRFLLLLRRTV